MKLYIKDENLEPSLGLYHEPEKPWTGQRTISASMVGDPCDAKVALKFRSFPTSPPTAKLDRTFRLGHVIEDLVIKDLKGAGWPVRHTDPANFDKQIRFTGWHGHVKCYVDGIIEWDNTLEEVLEIKSANDRSFKEMEKKTIPVAKPGYYDQATMAMGLSGLPSCVFVIFNKNTSEYLCERIMFDAERWEMLKIKIDRILQGDVEKISDDKDKWPCIFCEVKASCWEGLLPESPECHHCMFSYPDASKGFYCLRHEKPCTSVCDDFTPFKPRDK